MAARCQWLFLSVIVACGGRAESRSATGGSSGSTSHAPSTTSTGSTMASGDSTEPDHTSGGRGQISLAVDPRGFLLAIGYSYWFSTGPGAGYGCWVGFERFDEEGAPVAFPKVTASTDSFDCGVGAAFEDDGTLHVAAALGMKRYPPDADESARTTQVLYTRAFVLRDDASIVAATQGPSSSSSVVLVEVDPRGQVARTLELAELDGVVGLAETPAGGFVLVGKGDVVAIGLDERWDVQWTLQQEVPLVRATAVAPHREGGVWLADIDAELAPRLLRVEDSGELTNVAPADATGFGHTIVSIAHLPDGTVCTGGDRTESPRVWLTACHDARGQLRWDSEGPAPSYSRANADWTEPETAANAFAWTRLQAMANGDLVALVPEQGITRFTPQGEVLWIAPTSDAEAPDDASD